MRNIQREIQENLNAIEKKYDVKILLAVESGSRAWGFASPDSDYDVRFIYMRRPAEYLRIDPVKDVIEWQLDEVLDIKGWDLKKALLAFGKGNPNVMEWANSPIIYRMDPAWEELKSVAMGYFSEKSALCHYYGTARKTLQTFLTGDMVRYKKYFYALRPLLCCRWIERYHAAPPMAFDTLLTMFDTPDEVLTPGLYAAIKELLARKAVTEEKDLNPQMPEIIDFIRDECDRQKLLSDAAPDDHRHDFAELNDMFLGTVLGDTYAEGDRSPSPVSPVSPVSLVSACLAGVNCKYNGGNNYNEKVLQLMKDHEVILVCPEIMGGLPTPRVPAEIKDGVVTTQDGRNVDAHFHAGAQKCLELARRLHPDLIVLQSRSPSCGVNQVYDGTFTNTLVDGAGVTARLLKENGFRIIDIEDLK